MFENDPKKRTRRENPIKEILEKDHGYRFDGRGRSVSAIPIEDADHIPPSAKAVAKRMHNLKSTGRRPRDRRYPWHVMQHGQNFVVATPAERRAARMSLIAYMKTKECHLVGDYVMVSQSMGRGQGYRCWLISADKMPSVRRGLPREGQPIRVEDGPLPDLLQKD